MPKLSVNIPCFNSGRFIRQTVESVINQTFQDLEIVIVDDGSHDNTKQIISSFKDARIRYFYKDNEGLAFTRNKAIDLSDGEYIALLDHDDLWEPEKIEKQLEVFKKNNNLGLVFSDSYILENNHKKKFTYFDRIKPKKGFIFEDLLFASSNFIPLSSVIVRKDVFKDVGFFNPAFKIGEELELFLKVAQLYEFDYIDKPLITYRLHEGNFSTNKEIFVKEAFEILQFWQDRIPDLFHKNEKRLRKKEAAILAELAHFYANSSRKKEALHNFNLSLSKAYNKNVFIKKCILLFIGCLGYNLINKLRYGS